MARYKCLSCESDHGTDNMVAACAVCFARVSDSLAQATADIAKAQTMRNDKAIAFDLAKAERDILFGVVKAIAHDDACGQHHDAMAQDALKRAYEANGDAEKP